ncbi:uncharacterized protein LOC110976443 [Acanthaster planci]|uniref:Uncharacterized protein LOC110976443 n=1 Tax=Acanthaster planci TaxID=133434 RepID=A0A8B7XYW0_ACAPL|nr:uncharacterized protein LOC110976443 [Acanthaster planci]
MASTEASSDSDLPPLPDINNISKELAICRVFLNTFILISGFLGNSLILLVYKSKMRKNSTQILIMGLAGVDLTVCLCRIRNIFKFSYMALDRESPLITEVFAVPGRFALGMSGVLTGIIAFDRYDSVCRPHRRLFNRRRAKIALLGSFATSVFLEMPNFIGTILQSPNWRKTSHSIHITEYLIVLFLTIVCYGNVYATTRRRAKIRAEFLPPKNPVIPTISYKLNMQPDKTDASAIKTEFASTYKESSTPTPHASKPSTMFTTLKSSSSKSHQTFNAHKSAVEKSTPKELPLQNPPSAGVDTQEQRWAYRREVQMHIRLGKPHQTNPPLMRDFMQRRVTRMLFITGVVFLLAWLPYWIFIAADLFALNGGTLGEGVLAKLFSVAISVPFNSIVNPLIYGVANRHFRKECAVFFRRVC